MGKIHRDEHFPLRNTGLIVSTNTSKFQFDRQYIRGPQACSSQDYYDPLYAALVKERISIYLLIYFIFCTSVFNIHYCQ